MFNRRMMVNAQCQLIILPDLLLDDVWIWCNNRITARVEAADQYPQRLDAVDRVDVSSPLTL